MLIHVTFCSSAPVWWKGRNGRTTVSSAIFNRFPRGMPLAPARMVPRRRIARMPANRRAMPEIPSWVVPVDAAGTRLDKFLADRERLGSRSRVSDALAKGKVFVNGSEAAEADAGSRIRAGDVVGVWMDKPGSAQPRRREIGHGVLARRYE